MKESIFLYIIIDYDYTNNTFDIFILPLYIKR